MKYSYFTESSINVRYTKSVLKKEDVKQVTEIIN